MTYQEFIGAKTRRAQPIGFDMSEDDLHCMLYSWQRRIVAWAIKLGRAALFEDCGLGKTFQQIEWARVIAEKTGKPILIVAPLAVGQQTAREGARIDVDVTVSRGQKDMGPDDRIVVTNYEMLHHFQPDVFGGVVLDESAILRDQLGKTRTSIIAFAHRIPYRLACTATPAPNDLTELVNHAEYLGIMRYMEAMGLWFTQDGDTHNWRLKNHGAKDFWQWVASWAVALRSPADMGYPAAGFALPPMETIYHTVDGGMAPRAGELFGRNVTLHDQRRIRRETLAQRVKVAADMIAGDDKPWVVWCDLNDESSALAKAIPDAVEVRGSDSREDKERALTAFSVGAHRVIVTKPSIAGHGLNWQHCANVAFVGLSHSYEQYYQAVRRVWRFGQQRPVEVHVIAASADQPILQNIQRKEAKAMTMYDHIIHQMMPDQARSGRFVDTQDSVEVEAGAGWDLMLGDSVNTIDRIADHSVGLSVFSPPFPGMYVYTDSPHDMGNVQTIKEMIEQFRYLMVPDKMQRIMIPGRSVFVHITQGVAQKGRDGYVGMRDFRGSVIDMMQDHGWIYYGEVTIDKNPQAKAIRTKDAGLMFKSLARDSARMHPAMSDMLLQFRAPGDNPTPIRAGQSKRYGNTRGWMRAEDWILWARPVWYAADYDPETGGSCENGIAESDVLNVAAARSDEDERHLCPLQLGVIRRCVLVWSNPDELVYSPFAGVGSEGVVALQQKRRFIGGELKREYFDQAADNLRSVSEQGLLF